MFRKPLQISASTPLRSSEVRRLRADLVAQFPAFCPETLDPLLPPKAAIHALRLSQQGPVQLVYSRVDHPAALPSASLPLRYGQPLFFQLKDGHGPPLLVPTLYSLWAICSTPPTATLSPVFPVFITHFEVTTFLLKGADLMLPGVYRPIAPDVRREAVVVVMVRGNPSPVAVGIARVDPTEDATHGKAMTLCHVFNDELWALGSKTVPNGGFQAQIIAPCAPADSPTLQIHGLPSAPLVPDQATAQPTQQNPDHRPQTIQEAEITPSRSDVDRVLINSFLQACQTSAKSNALFPLEASKFFNDHLLPARPDTTVRLDIKTSSFKKVGVFLRAMDKRGLCKVKEVHGQLQVLRVLRNNAEYVKFCPRDDNSSDQEHNRPGKSMPGPAANEMIDTQKNTTSAALIEDVYRLSTKMRPIAKPASVNLADLIGSAAIKDTETQHFSIEELIKVVDEYISREQLFCNPPMKTRSAELHVRLDAHLTDALYPASKKPKQPMEYPDRLPMREVRDKFVAAADIYHRISSRGPLANSVVKRGRVKPITITLEDRQGGRKHVTRARGFEIFRVDVRDFASVCQTQFACSATTSELPGKTKSVGPVQYEMQMQGDFLTGLRDFLCEQCCFVSEHIELVNRSKSGKKR